MLFDHTSRVFVLAQSDNLGMSESIRSPGPPIFEICLNRRFFCVFVENAIFSGSLTGADSSGLVSES
jgi:hypothetical protein